MSRTAQGKAGVGLEPTRYDTLWRPNGQDWRPGPALGLGFTWDVEKQISIPSVQLGADDFTMQSGLSVDGAGRLVVDIDLVSLASIICALDAGAFLKCQAKLSLDATEFSGSVGQLCSGKVDSAWKGTWVRSTTHPSTILHRFAEAVRAQNADHAAEEGA